jgi:hypothetical protein
MRARRGRCSDRLLNDRRRHGYRRRGLNSLRLHRFGLLGLRLRLSLGLNRIRLMNGFLKAP